MKTKSTTYNEGANDERDAVLAYVRRIHKHCTIMGHPTQVVAERIIKWLLGRAKRYGKAKGGLGK